MEGDCLAYVASCSLELATESFQVYQQCKKKRIKMTSNLLSVVFFKIIMPMCNSCK